MAIPVRIMNGLSCGRRFLQRVAQRAAGVVHEHVVERRALHRQRLHGDAGRAAASISAIVVAGPLLRRDAEDVVVRRDTLSTSGQRARASLPSPAASPRSSTSSTFLPGIDAFSFSGESSAFSSP